MAIQLAHQSHWRDDGTCSYCGSLSPELLFEAIARGDEIEPTDKNYKIYVRRPNPKAGEACLSGTANHNPGDGWVQVTPENRATLPPEIHGPACQAKDGDYVLLSTQPARTHDKFYFQHFTEEEKQRFVELMNAKKINLGYPGRFYRLPFFVRIEEKV